MGYVNNRATRECWREDPDAGREVWSPAAQRPGPSEEPREEPREEPLHLQGRCSLTVKRKKNVPEGFQPFAKSEVPRAL